MAETQCKSVVFPHQTLRSLLSDAIVELCRREAFYVEELRIEGTICVVSDRSSALIVQITEQVGNKTPTNDANDAGDGQLPVVVTTKVNIDSVCGTTPVSGTHRGEGRLSSPTVKSRFTRRRLHPCRHCGAHFVRLGSLQSHIRRRHPLAVFSAPRKRLLSSSRTRSSMKQVEAASNMSSAEMFNQNVLLTAMKSEPGYSGDGLPAFPRDINLGLQQMVRTLSMMSSLPINNNGHFPMASSSVGTYPPDDDPIELRRSADGKFACPYCTKTYGFKHSLKEHIDVHRGRRPHVCRHCGASFAHLASLCAHIRRRHDDRMPSDFRCSLCGEKLMNLQSLKQHRTWRHKDAPRLSDPLPPVSVTPATTTDFCKDHRTPMSLSADQLPGSKKDGRSTVGNFTALQRSSTVPWPPAAFPSASASCGSIDLHSKLPPANTRLHGQRKDSELPPFDGFDFHGYLSSVNDFQPVTAASWSAGHVTTPGHVTGPGSHVTTPGVDAAVTDECRNLVSAANSHKYFPDVPPELPAPGHSQSKTPADLQYRPSDGIPDPFFMTVVCPGCSAKFRTEAEYRRHVSCHPDHLTLPWQQ